MSSSLIAKDLQHIWHPASQMKDFKACPPLLVHAAKGSYLYTDKGPIIDAISSWWCKSLGHGHPKIIEAISKQLNQFEHIIGANTTHKALVDLGEKLALITNKQHVFFASDGASAIEIALKLAMHANKIKGRHHKDAFLALENGYHGETFATLSVSDLGRYKIPYNGYGLNCLYYIRPIPYVSGPEDPLWKDAKMACQKILRMLDSYKDNVCALILEPLIQGAGNMRCYSAYFLKELAAWAKQNEIYLIADEIMTGMGRTGTWLASTHADIEPDMICLSKGLTAGTLPMSTVSIDKEIYNLFYKDYKKEQNFLHSHTYSCNALAVAAALATIEVMEAEAIHQRAQALGRRMLATFTAIANTTRKLTNIRSFGAMVAGDLVPIDNKRVGHLLSQEALKHGALLRPIGNTLYWLPPLTMETDTLDTLAEITLHSIKKLYK